VTQYLQPQPPVYAGYQPPEDDEDPEQDPDAPNNANVFEQQVQEASLPGPAGAAPPDGSGDGAPLPYLDSNGDQGSGSYIPGAVGVTQDALNAPPPPQQGQQGHAFAPMPPVSGAVAQYQADMEAKRAANLPASPTNPNGYPVRPTPKWYERIAAAGLGAAAGYSNAARRAAPIDINKATEPLLYPGYDSKLAAWQSRVIPLEKAAEISGQQVMAQYAGQKAQSEVALRQAQTQAAIDHGTYWLKRSDQEKNQWKIDPSTGGLWNTITGQRTEAPSTPEGRNAAAIALGASPAEARYYAFNKKMPEPAKAVSTTGQPTAAMMMGMRAAGHPTGNPYYDAIPQKDAQQNIDANKDRAPRDPFTDWARIQVMDAQEQKDLQGIGNTKNVQGRAVMDARDRAIQQNATLKGKSEQEIWADGNPNEIKILHGINAQFAPRLQDVYSAFDAAAAAHNIPTTKLRVDPNTFQSIPVPETPQQPAATATPAAGPGRRPPVAAPTAPASPLAARLAALRGGQAPVATPAAPAPAPQPTPAAPANKFDANLNVVKPNAAPVGNPITVNLPGGKMNTFPNQAALDAFSKESGITFGPAR